MKIIAINGSPKKKESTTEFALKKALDQVSLMGLSTQLINLSQYHFGGCQDCGFCRSQLGCSLKDDFTYLLIDKLKSDDVVGFILGTPVYFGGMTSQLKAFFDRCVIFRRNGFLFENKVLAALSVGRSRHGGQELTQMDILRSGLIQGMVVVSDCAPTSHFGANLWSGHEGGIEQDKIGIETAANVGKKVAIIAKKLNL